MCRQANLALQGARLSVAQAELSSAEAELTDKEAQLASVKAQYDQAVAEKTRLTQAADACRRKMHAASQLINGLGGEKIRWTQQSKAFKEQMGR